MFKSLNIGTVYSRKISDTKYQGLTLSKDEKNKYPYATLGVLKVDIYNKTDTPLNITSLDILYNQNNKVINTDTVDYTGKIYSHDCQYIYVPFKYYGSNIKTTIVLKTNMGNITIYNPDLLFGVIHVE